MEAVLRLTDTRAFAIRASGKVAVPAVSASSRSSGLVGRAAGNGEPPASPKIETDTLMMLSLSKTAAER